MVIGQFASGMITLMLAKLVLNDLPHVVFGNPGNPGNPGLTTDKIIARTGMKEYEYRWFPEPAEEAKKRVYPYTKTRVVGTYEIKMTRTDDTCMIRLYEYLEGWKKKLRATWSGFSRPECDMKFEHVAETIRQVRFEEKTALMR